MNNSNSLDLLSIISLLILLGAMIFLPIVIKNLIRNSRKENDKFSSSSSTKNQKAVMH